MGGFKLVTEYLAPLKLAFDTLKVGIGIVKDVKDALPTEEQRNAVAAAVEKSEIQFQLAEVQMAQALGYELCKCRFPPTIMLSVGYMSRGGDTGKSVYECPTCKRNTASPYAFIRTHGEGLAATTAKLIDKGQFRYFADENGKATGTPICPRCEQKGDYLAVVQDRSKGIGRITYYCPGCKANYGPHVPRP